MLLTKTECLHRENIIQLIKQSQSLNLLNSWFVFYQTHTPAGWCQVKWLNLFKHGCDEHSGILHRCLLVTCTRTSPQSWRFKDSIDVNKNLQSQQTKYTDLCREPEPSDQRHSRRLSPHSLHRLLDGSLATFKSAADWTHVSSPLDLAVIMCLLLVPDHADFCQNCRERDYLLGWNLITVNSKVQSRAELVNRCSRETQRGKTVGSCNGVSPLRRHIGGHRKQESVVFHSPFCLLYIQALCWNNEPINQFNSIKSTEYPTILTIN